VIVSSAAGAWGPTVVAALAILSSLATTLYLTRKQGHARREDHEHQLEVVLGDREHDIALRRVEYEHERSRRLEDERLSAAAQLAGTLTAISSKLHLHRTAQAAEELDAIERLLNDGQDQHGRLSLLLGDRHPLVLAAASALLAFQYAHGWARQELDPEQDPYALSGADATAKKDEWLGDGSRAMLEFWTAARESGIASEVEVL
jgi:hypothetical protein